MSRLEVNQHIEALRAETRLIMKGSIKEEWVDYFDTNAPTPSVPSIPLLNGVAIRNGVKLSHLGIEEASVRALLEEEV